jgi:Uma2 family endonuclease
VVVSHVSSEGGVNLCDAYNVMSAVVQPGSGYIPPVEYPESDGKPMGETDVHRDEMADTIDILKDRYRDVANVYVAGNLLVYYEEGDATARFAPDVFVVFGVPKRRRRTYKLWEEKRPPTFVLEVTSRGTRYEDKGLKKEIYSELGVSDYFLFDPEADYLKPPLQGFRLVGGDRYERIAPDKAGRLYAESLGLYLTIEGGRLRLIDPATGERLLRPEEARAAAREATARAAQEAARAKQAEDRAAAAEAELEKLRALLLKERRR